jgi:hypothetical protein
MWADGHVDRQKKLVVAFLNFVNAPKNGHVRKMYDGKYESLNWLQKNVVMLKYCRKSKKFVHLLENSLIFTGKI